MIYTDPSEARENTRLPQEIIDIAVVLPELESLTGADMLICDGDTVIHGIESVPDRIRFEGMCKSGALIQRKTERDICGSIPYLKDILCKMLQYSPLCWLVIDGLVLRIKGDKLGFYSHDKRAYIPTEFSYPAYLSAILKWQWRGGYYANLSNVNDWPMFVNSVLDIIEDVKANPTERIVHTKYQSLQASDWKDTLATLPGIGAKRARDWAGKTLAKTLCELSTSDGSKTRANIRSYMGLQDGFNLRIVPEIDASDAEEIAY